MEKKYLPGNHEYRKKILILFYLSAFISVLIFLAAVSGLRVADAENWEGYHLLLLPADNGNIEIQKALEGSGFFSEVVTCYNTAVEYSNYNSLEKITVDKLPARFNPLDPRLDRFLMSVTDYFRAGSKENEYTVFYLKTGSDYTAAKGMVQSLLGREDWIMPGGKNPLLWPASLILFASVLSLFAAHDKKNAFVYIIASIPWFFVIHANSRAYFFPAILILFVFRWIMLMLNDAEKSYIKFSYIDITRYYNRGSISAAAVMVSAVIFPSMVAGGFPSVLTAVSLIVLEAMIAFTLVLHSAWRVTGYCHRIFINTEIIAPKGKKKILSMDSRLLIAIYLLAVSIIPFYLAREGTVVNYPVPVSVRQFPDKGITFDYLKKISDKTPLLHFLPDYSDYIRHLAYQTRLPYRTDYSVPDDNESISISHYYQEKNNYRIEKTVVNQFTEKWLNDNITIDKDRGITGLMISSKGMILAAAGSFSPVYPLIIPAVFCLLLPLVIYMISGRNVTEKTGGMKNNLPLIRRRKQQAA